MNIPKKNFMGGSKVNIRACLRNDMDVDVLLRGTAEEITMAYSAVTANVFTLLAERYGDEAAGAMVMAAWENAEKMVGDGD